MSIVFQTSFDHYTTVAQRFTANANTGGGLSITSGGRNSTNCLSTICSSNSGDGQGSYVRRLLGATYSTLYMAFAVNLTDRLPDTSSRPSEIASFMDTGNVQVSLGVHADGTLKVYKGVQRTGTLLGSSSGLVLITGNYYHIEWAATIHASAGTVDVWVNEVNVIHLTGQDTKGYSGSALINEIFIGQVLRADFNINGTRTYNFDDLVVRDDVRSGDVAVKAFLPTGVGSTNMWTPNTGTSATATDESAPNSDTDYIASSNAGDETLLTFGTVAANAVIHAVIPIPFAEKTDAGTATFKNSVRISGTTYTPGATISPSASSYAFLPDILYQSPATGVTWTATEFNAVEIGVRRIS